MNKPVWVLDTNVVLDLLYFGDVVTRPLLQALEAGCVGCVVSDATLDEFRRVLTYPGFALGAERQMMLFERYRAVSLQAAAETGSGNLPRCSDPDDQKFLELAAAAGAQLLVSKDRALLKLRRRCAPLFQILTPAEAVRWLQDISQDSVAET